MKFHSLTLVKNPLLIPQVVRMRRHGIVYPIYTHNAAKRQGLDLALACAIVMRETSGGKNVFGHDPTICIGWGTVTKKKYHSYLNMRNRTGKLQGVGSCQLTSRSLQDEADKLGGCWKPYWNMIVGFHYLAGLVHKYGLHDGVMHYNGSGPAAEVYANSIMRSRHSWKLILSGKAVHLNDK